MRQMITAAMEANNKISSPRNREERQRGCKKCSEEQVQTRFQKSWDTVQIVNKKGMQ